MKKEIEMCVCNQNQKCLYHARLSGVQVDRGVNLEKVIAPTQSDVESFKRRMRDWAHKNGIEVKRRGWVHVDQHGRPYMADVNRRVSVVESADGAISTKKWL
jgi:hypothetical protein